MSFAKKIAISLMVLFLTLQCTDDDNDLNNNNNGSENTGDENNNGEPSDISALTSIELTKKMNAGWNLGNTLDSHWGTGSPWNVSLPLGQETMWGNPTTTKAMIDTVKAVGFDTIRVPVTWYMATGAAPAYSINTAWMNRVQEIVDYVIDNGMFCILNTHHDDHHTGTNGYIKFNDSLSGSEKNSIKEQFGKTWEQIAARFKDYDEHLLFEGLNEPGMHDGGSWSLGKANFINELLQIFIDTVRAGGGKNSNRHLLVTPYNAAINLWANSPGELNAFLDSGAKKIKVTDSKNRLIVSLHYYEPYGFCMAESGEWYRATYNTGDGHISGNRNAVINAIKNFTNNGIPVIMGETGALMNRAEAERVKWANDYVKQVRTLGVPVVVWDDGGGFKLLDRNNQTWVSQAYVNAFVNAAKAP